MGIWNKGSLFAQSKKLTQVEKVPKSVQQLIPVYRISKNGIFEIEHKKGLHLFDKAYYLSDINYAIQDEAEQEESIKNYCKFLNTFSVSIKIVVANQRKDMEKLKKEILLNNPDDPLALEFDRIIKERIEEGKNGIEQVKYLIVTVEKETYEDAKNYFNALEIEMATCLRQLKSKILPLNWKERLHSLYAFYRLGQEQDFPDLDWDKLQKSKQNWKNDICNLAIKETKNMLELEDRFCCVLFAKRYPGGDLEDTFFSELSNVPFHVITTLDIAPIPDHIAKDKLMECYASIEQNIIKQQELRNKNNSFSTDISYDKRREKEEVEEYLDEMRTNDESMFQVGLYVVITAQTQKELEANVSNIKSIGSNYNFQLELHTWNQIPALQTALPLGGRYVKTMRSLFTQRVAVLMPFYAQELQEEGGLYYGTNQLSKNLIIADRKTLPNGNGFILAGTGGGKSVTVKCELYQTLLNTQDDVIVIDPQNEYFDITKERGGQVINISSTTQNYMNPLEMPEVVENRDAFISSKIEFIYGICEQAMKKPLTAQELSLIDRCTTELYRSYFDKPVSPTMKELKDLLQAVDRREAQDLALGLERFVTGSLRIFSHESNVDMENRFICFGIADLGEALRPISMLVMLESIQNRINSNSKIGRATRVWIDEFHVLSGREFSAKYLEALWKKVRKMGGLCTGITQNLSDLLITKTTSTMVSNSEFILLLRQSSADIDLLKETFKLTDAQIKYVNGVPVGTGLIKYGDKWIPNDNTIPAGLLYDMVNTNMHEKVKKGFYKNKENLGKSIKVLKLSVSLENILYANQITTMESLCALTSTELLQIPKIGEKSVFEIKHKLEKADMQLTKEKHGD